MHESVPDCAEMWSLWHGSKLEQYTSRNKAEKQPLLTCDEGSAHQTQHYADLMWRSGSPDGYQPPILTANDEVTPSGRSDSWLQHPRHADMQQKSHLRHFSDHRQRGEQADGLAPRTHSQNSTGSNRPGTPPSITAHHTAPRYSDHGYQPLLDPLLPISDLQPSTRLAQHSAHPPPYLGPSTSPKAGPCSDPSLRSSSPTLTRLHSAPANEQYLPGLNIPLDSHERQLLSNLLQRSHSTRSQDRSSEHSHSSASTHHDGQMPLSRLHSLSRSLSDRHLTSKPVLQHDKRMLDEPSDLSRQMKRIGSGQLMVTENDKVMTPSNLGLIGASRISRSPSRHQQLFLHSIQEDGTAQVHAVPLGRSEQEDSQQGMRMWKEQLKWVLLWLTLSLLTCMHSAALILALQYNLIAMAFGGMFCVSGLLGMYGSCLTLAGFCMSRHFAISGISIFKIKQIEVLAFTTMVISGLAAIIHFASVNIIHNVGTGTVPGGHICAPGDAACEQNYNFVIIMMVSTTVLYGCHALVSAALAFKAHGVRRAVRQLSPEPLLL